MPTLTNTETLALVMQAFTKKLFPILPMGTDFRTGASGLKLNGVYQAHIATLGATAAYDATTGYKNGATSARTLLVDVPITASNHRHAPILLEYLNRIKDRKQEYMEVISGLGYSLAKYVLDDILAAITIANFSESTGPVAVADCDTDMLTAMTGAMNKVGAGEMRNLIVNTDVANVIGADARMASQDFQNQRTGGSPFRRWTNCFGWQSIQEYPDFPTNSQNLGGFGFDKRAISLMAGPPEPKDSELSAQLNIKEVMNFETMTDPDTGLTMAAVSWQDPGTGDFYWTPTIVWGRALGSQGGAAGTVADYAGNRLVTA